MSIFSDKRVGSSIYIVAKIAYIQVKAGKRLLLAQNGQSVPLIF
jgi:hypothetical protein